MKLLLFILLCAASFVCSAQQAQVVVNVPITDVYIPGGFDSNDEIDIVIEGILPSLCHFNPSVSIEEKRGSSIIISAKANDLRAPCVKVFIPFVKVLKVKGLSPGAYRLFFKNPSSELMGIKLWNTPMKLVINQPRMRYQDENIYANIQSIHSLDKNTIVLKGIHPSDCFKLREIQKVLDKPNVLVIVPIMERDQTVNCLPPKQIPFEYKIDLRDQEIADKTLIHVRSVSGQSFNLIHSL